MDCPKCGKPMRTGHDGATPAFACLPCGVLCPKEGAAVQTIAHPAKRDKYNRAPKEERIWTDGDTSICFDSKGERRRWEELLILWRAGQITDLRRQVEYVLVNDPPYFRLCYVADFVYVENGKTIVEDFKGFRSREYLQKRRLMRERHGITIRETH